VCWCWHALCCHVICWKPLKTNLNFKKIYVHDARCIHEIKSRTATAKAAFNKEKTLFTRKLGLHLRKKPVKHYIWNITLYGAETWTLQKVDQKYLESSEMWCWRRMENIRWTDDVKKKKYCEESMGESDILHTRK
jgi:hypothetical protein